MDGDDRSDGAFVVVSREKVDEEGGMMEGRGG